MRSDHSVVAAAAVLTPRRGRRMATLLQRSMTALLLLTATAQASEATTASAADEAANATTARLDALFDATFTRYALPGLAVGVIENGKVVYRRTAGETRAGSGEKVNAQTLFKIASNSKAMTTAALARLADAGKLDWNDRVVTHLPQFRMHDAWVTREIQLRDLLIHNSGLRAGAGDLMLWPEPNDFSRADVIAALPHLKPAWSFRSRYSYDNLLYIVAGEVGAAAAGTSYEELLRREVFQPLGLTRCQVGQWQRDAVGNVAQPHMRKDGRNIVIRADGRTIPVVASAAAGGIRCSLDDMLIWTRAWLDPATRAAGSGTAWLSQAQRDALWTAQMPLPLGARQRDWDDAHFSAYGYGWRLSDVDGTLKVSHTGTLAGMYSVLTLLPQKNVGFVVLINGDGSEARTVLNQALVKHYSAPQQNVDIAGLAAQLAPAATPAATAEADAPQRTAVTPQELERWSGVYRDPWFGEISICPQGDKVIFSAAKSPRLKGPVLRQQDRWLVDWDDDSVDAEPWLDFQAEEGAATRLSLAHVNPEADFSYDYPDLAFVRVGDCKKSRGDRR